LPSQDVANVKTVWPKEIFCLAWAARQRHAAAGKQIRTAKHHEHQSEREHSTENQLRHSAPLLPRKRESDTNCEETADRYIHTGKQCVRCSGNPALIGFGDTHAHGGIQDFL